MVDASNVSFLFLNDALSNVHMLLLKMVNEFMVSFQYLFICCSFGVTSYYKEPKIFPGKIYNK